MLKKIRHCDRCDRVIPEDCKKAGLIGWDLKNKDGSLNKGRGKDLCGSCSMDFLKFWKTEEDKNEQRK